MVAIVLIEKLTPLMELAPAKYHRAVSPFVVPVGGVLAVLTGVSRPLLLLFSGGCFLSHYRS